MRRWKACFYLLATLDFTVSSLHRSQSMCRTLKSKATSASDFVRESRAQIEFQILALQSQLALIDDLEEMPEEEKMTTLFSLLDKDGDGAVSAVELADGLRKIRGDLTFEESLAEAVDRVAYFDDNEDAKLDKGEFENMVQGLLAAIGCTFTEFAELLIFQLLFSETGNTAEENVAGQILSSEVDNAVKGEESFRKALGDKRMRALFSVFDINNDQSCDFKEIVLGMYALTDDLDGSAQAAVSALLMFDHNQSKSLNYEEFAEFISSVVAASGHSFDEVANKITKLASQSHHMTPEDMEALFSMDASMQMLQHLKAEAEDSVMALTALEVGKCNRLFDMFDTDRDGNIDFAEAALALNKFSENRSARGTAEDAAAIFQEFDADGDQKLDRKEFALFIAQFAARTGGDVKEMVDMLLVCAALKENSEAEAAYLKALTFNDVYYGDF